MCSGSVLYNMRNMFMGELDNLFGGGGVLKSLVFKLYGDQVVKRLVALVL